MRYDASVFLGLCCAVLVIAVSMITAPGINERINTMASSPHAHTNVHFALR